MYCSSCGGAVPPGLVYCNHCGTRLSGTKDDGLAKPSELFPESLIWAIVSVFVVGIGSIIGLLAVMKEVVHLEMAWIIGFTLLSFLLVFVVEGVLIKQLLHRRSGKLEGDVTTRSLNKTTKELNASPAKVLSEPVNSITEHTTRTLEPVYRERKSK